MHVYIRTIVCFAAAAAVAAAAHADQIRIGGITLEGQVTGVRAAGIEFAPSLGEGKLTIPFADIEELATDGRFYVLYGEEGEARGLLLDVGDGVLRVGDDEATATEVPVASIYRGARLDGALSSFQRVRNRWRYWTGSFDTGFAVTQGTTDTTNTSIGFRSERRKPGTRFVLGANYLFGTEKQDGGSTSTLSNEVLALTKAEYDLTPRILALGSFDAEYDEVERLSYRLVPRLGFGYRIFKSETAFFQVESAPAYVFERFFGGDEEDFFGISFGAETEVKLPYSAVFAGRIDYLPSVSDWIDDYLLRSEISLTLPLIGFVNFRAALSNQYDNTPAEGTDRNELQTTVGLSVTL